MGPVQFCVQFRAILYNFEQCVQQIVTRSICTICTISIYIGHFEDNFDQFDEQFEEIYRKIYAYRLFTKYLPILLMKSVNLVTNIDHSIAQYCT